MTDRSSKILLTLIAIALWGLLLHPFLVLPPVLAQSSNQTSLASQQPALIAFEGKPIILVRYGTISVWTVENTTSGVKLRRLDEKDLLTQ